MGSPTKFELNPVSGFKCAGFSGCGWGRNWPLLLPGAYVKMETHYKSMLFNTLRPIQHGRYFTDDVFNAIFLNEDIWISINISLKFVPEVLISNIPALIQIMAWRRPGDKPLSEPMMVSLLTHICVSRHQWVNKAFLTGFLIRWRFYSWDLARKSLWINMDLKMDFS